MIFEHWGKWCQFFPHLSLHTLEIGYDVPEVRVAIILATTSNINQIVQRTGRIKGKDEILNKRNWFRQPITTCSLMIFLKHSLMRY